MGSSGDVIASRRGVLVIDRVLLLREGLAELLSARGMTVATSDADESSIVTALRSHRPDVVVLNWSTSDLGRNVACIRREQSVAILAVGVADRAADVIRCAELSLAGFTLADDSVDTLCTLVAAADLSTARCPETAVPLLMQAVADNVASSASHLALTQREREVVELVGAGLSDKEIARRLGIALPTVKNHLHHVYEKLHVRNRTEAVMAFRSLPVRAN